jgi:hypothetical protein
MAATEDGLLPTEDWEDIQPSPGHAHLMSPATKLEFDRDSGQVRRKEGYEEFLVTIHPPERPY